MNTALASSELPDEQQIECAIRRRTVWGETIDRSRKICTSCAPPTNVALIGIATVRRDLNMSSGPPGAAAGEQCAPAHALTRHVIHASRDLRDAVCLCPADRVERIGRAWGVRHAYDWRRGVGPDVAENVSSPARVGEGGGS